LHRRKRKRLRLKEGDKDPRWKDPPWRSTKKEEGAEKTGVCRLTADEHREREHGKM
jgi:hypothetical protein